MKFYGFSKVMRRRQVQNFQSIAVKPIIYFAHDGTAISYHVHSNFNETESDFLLLNLCKERQ